MKGLPVGLLDDVGGHALSAGFSIAENKISKLKERVIKLLRRFSEERD